MSAISAMLASPVPPEDQSPPPCCRSNGVWIAASSG